MRTAEIQDLKHLVEAHFANEGQGPSDAEECCLVPGTAGFESGLHLGGLGHSSLSRLHSSFLLLFPVFTQEVECAYALCTLLYVHFYYTFFHKFLWLPYP